MNLLVYILTSFNTLVLRLLSFVFLSFKGISFTLLVDLFLTVSKLLSHLFTSSHLTLHPWVSNNVSHTQSLVGKQLQHIGNQVFEVIRVETLCFSRLVSFPEEIGSI